MMTYEMDIAGLKRDLPLFQVSSENYVAAFVLFGDVELTVRCAAEMLKLAPEYDYLLAAEVKSIPLLYEMARQSGDERYFLAHREQAFYMSGALEVSLTSRATMGTQKLVLDTADAELISGKRILIIDDVVSTGSTVGALEELVTKAGGQVAGRMAILVKDAAAQGGDIIYLATLPDSFS